MYLEEGYPSMHAFCIEFFHFSKDVAFKRIYAARTARVFPVLFGAVEDGRLHLSAVRLIAPHLTPANVAQLIAIATHRTCEDIEEMIARRFVRLETLLEGQPETPSEPDSMIPQQAARPVVSEPAQLTQLLPGPSVPDATRPASSTPRRARPRQARPRRAAPRQARPSPSPCWLSI